MGDLSAVLAGRGRPKDGVADAGVFGSDGVDAGNRAAQGRTRRLKSPAVGRKVPSFPCRFRPLGLKARHVRSPRTPGGLLRNMEMGRVAAFSFLTTRT